MKQFFLCFVVLILNCPVLHAQGENNIWTFGMDSNPAINFNLPSPGITMLPNSPNITHWASAVCFPNGQLRFYVRLKFNFGGTPEYYIYDPTGNAISGSDLDSDAGMLDFSMPVVIPKPGNADQYYIFYSKDDGLLYCLLDMSLNGGQGAVSPTEKDIPLTAPASIYTRLITAVKGCNATWLVVRSQTSNEYYSWAVTPNGVDTHRITSEIGSFQMEAYPFGGFLKASHDGHHLATTNWAGVEMYDFEKCSGKLKNAQVLDATGNPAYFPGAAVILPSHRRFTGVGFSPDDSKLYVTRNGFENFEVIPGDLFQFNVSLPTLPAIITSRALVFQNLPYLGADISGFCNQITPNPLGEVKAGPDGRVYIDNGSVNCRDTANVPPGFNPATGFHVLDAPNNPAATCLPVFNRIVYSTGAEFYGSGYPNSFLQNDIVLAGPPNAVSMNIIPVNVCFRSSTALTVNAGTECVNWDNGDTAHVRVVTQPGKYWVQYFSNCQNTVDTYVVNFIPVPLLQLIDSSCQNSPSGRLSLTSHTSGSEQFQVIWKDSDGNLLRDRHTHHSDTIAGLPQGDYSVQYLTQSGCDTTLYLSVFDYPEMHIQASPADTTIRYGTPINLNASGALLYVWYPSGSLDTPTKSSPVATPIEPITYTVIGLNEHGCRDTAYVKIDIDYRMPDLVPNAFSPNGDGLNDVFRIEGVTYQQLKAFRVFNRFGQQIFFTMDSHKGWDGTQNGSPCDAGVYHYLIQIVYPDNKVKSLKGDVTLIR